MKKQAKKMPSATNTGRVFYRRQKANNVDSRTVSL